MWLLHRSRPVRTMSILLWIGVRCFCVFGRRVRGSRHSTHRIGRPQRQPARDDDTRRHRLCGWKNREGSWRSVDWSRSGRTPSKRHLAALSGAVAFPFEAHRPYGDLFEETSRRARRSAQGSAAVGCGVAAFPPGSHRGHSQRLSRDDLGSSYCVSMGCSRRSDGPDAPG
jgi:hypothetical protein